MIAPRHTDPPRIVARAVPRERYRVGSQIGVGQSGTVHRAIDTLTGETVAIKRLSPELRGRSDVAARFAELGAIARRVESPHVVRVLEIEREPDGVPFLVLELVEGTDLARLIETGAPMTAARAIHLGVQLLEALGAAHVIGLSHRRLVPTNCLVTDVPGDAEFVKVIGFDTGELAASLDATHDSESTRAALAYFAPEQVRSAQAADDRSDLYSVGVLLYEMLTRRRPFQAADRNGLVLAICTEPPPPLRDARPDLSVELCAAIEHALVKDPNARHRDAAAFLTALRATPESRGDLAVPGGAPVDAFGQTMIGDARLLPQVPLVPVAAPTRAKPRKLRARQLLVLLGAFVLIPVLAFGLGTFVRGRARSSHALPSWLVAEVSPPPSLFALRPAVTLEPTPAASSVVSVPPPAPAPNPKPKPKPTATWIPSIFLPPIFAPLPPPQGSGVKPNGGG